MKKNAERFFGIDDPAYWKCDREIILSCRFIMLEISGLM